VKIGSNRRVKESMIDRQLQWYAPPSLTGNEALLLFSVCDTGYLACAFPLIISVDIFSPGQTSYLNAMAIQRAAEWQFRA
jgi:hypothetical protein